MRRFTSALSSISGGGIAEEEGGGLRESGVQRRLSPAGSDGESSSLETSTTRVRRVRLARSGPSGAFTLSDSGSSSGAAAGGSSEGADGPGENAISPDSSTVPSDGAGREEGAVEEEEALLEPREVARTSGLPGSLREGWREACEGEASELEINLDEASNIRWALVVGDTRFFTSERV